MQFVVSVEPSQDRGFLARSPLVPNVTAEAPTADQAVADLQRQLVTLVSRGELREIEVPRSSENGDPAANPWQEVAGIFKTNPLFDEVLEQMQVYRRERDHEMDEVAD